jgi:small subunit ribosomal protein S8
MDQIADMFNRIRNAINARKEAVDLPHSKMKEGIAKILMEEGYISRYEAITKMNKRVVRISLKYTGKRKNMIEGIRRVSTPGRRIYAGKDAIPQVQAGYGTVIITTPQGLMTGETASSQKVGGEVICYIW